MDKAFFRRKGFWAKVRARAKEKAAEASPALKLVTRQLEKDRAARLKMLEAFVMTEKQRRPCTFCGRISTMRADGIQRRPIEFFERLSGRKTVLSLVRKGAPLNLIADALAQSQAVCRSCVRQNHMGRT